MTGFTHEYYMRDRIHSRVLRVRHDSLTSIQLLLASTKLHNRSYSTVFSTCQQSWVVCFSCHMSQHASYLQNFSRHKVLLTFFVNLDVNCTIDSHIVSYSSLFLTSWPGRLATSFLTFYFDPYFCFQIQIISSFNCTTKAMKVIM